MNGRLRGDLEESGIGELWWYACAMLEINSDTGMSKMSGVLAARRMHCNALGRVTWACGVAGLHSSCWGWMLWIKCPWLSLSWGWLSMHKVTDGNQMQKMESEMEKGMKRSSELRKAHCLSGAARYIADGKSAQEFERKD